MIGMQKITDARLQNLTPLDVFITVFDYEPEFMPGTHPELDYENGFLGDLIITPKDNPYLLDFRSLKGVKCHLNGIDERRVMAIFNRLMQFDPKRVVATGFGRIVDSEEK